MILEKRIYEDYKLALKSQNKQKAQYLSFLRAGMKNLAISQKTQDLTDDDVIAVLKKEQKLLEEAKESGITLNKPEMVEKAEQELAILTDYLPEPLTDKELGLVIDAAIKETSAVSMKDMGNVMKAVKAQAGARADAKKVSNIVRQRLC